MIDLNSTQLLRLYIDYTAYRDAIVWPKKPIGVCEFFNLNRGTY